jgi:hypothetical protein
VEELGGEETKDVTPDDEAMHREMVIMCPKCDRSGSKDTTQVEVPERGKEEHGGW